MRETDMGGYEEAYSFEVEEAEGARLSEEEYAALEERLRAAEEEYCYHCSDLSKCQFEGSRGYRYDALTNTYEECQLHRSWAVKEGLRRKLEESGIPKMHWGLDLRETLYSHHPAELDAALKLLNKIYVGEARAAVLEGGEGRDKSALVSALGASLIKANRKVVYTTAGELVNALRWGSEEYSRVRGEVIEAEYLIIEDIGSERASEYNEEQLWLVISARERGDRPTIVSTRGHAYRGRLEEWLKKQERVQL